jgi:hypothetical protein
LCGSNDEEYDARSAGFSLNGKGNSRYQQQLIQLKIGDWQSLKSCRANVLTEKYHLWNPHCWWL